VAKVNVMDYLEKVKFFFCVLMLHLITCLSLIKGEELLNVIVKPFLEFEKSAASAKQGWCNSTQDFSRAVLSTSGW
jgi:hypothetical protein